MKRFWGYVFGFFVACGWFSVIIDWQQFSDPDVYYHAEIAKLVLAHGPVHVFPWLDLTLLGTHYADLHFLFHIVLIPFVSVFGIFRGGHIAAVVLSALLLVGFYECLRRLQIRWPLVWTALLACAQPFLVRTLLGKATPLALLLYVVGLTVFWKRRPWLVGVIACLFALTHGGWPYLVGSCVLLAFADVLYVHIVLSKTWGTAFRDALWWCVLGAGIGALSGLVLHPNFPNDFLFSWTQIVTIGLGTPFEHVQLGNEWLPVGFGPLAASFATWLMLALLGLLGLFLAPRRPIQHAHARLLTALGWILAVLLALTLKSRRNVEYLAPVVVLWTATLWSLVDVSRFIQEVKIQFSSVHRVWGVSALVVVSALFFVSVGRGPWEAWKAFRVPGYTATMYQDAMQPISARAAPGDRVFHSSWDEFPVLFALDDRLRYISGLDPTFLYVASSTLSDQVRDVTWGVTTSTQEATWSLIHDQLDSKFVFVTKKSHPKFYDLIASDPRYIVLFDATDTASFEVSAGKSE